MFKKILVANRGEIAVRVIRACAELNIKTVAVYSEADKNSQHIQLADESWLLEGHPSKVYLDINQIVDIAQKSQAEAVHPGYGFLSENADFAHACEKAGLVFIGPKPDVIRQMGSKIEARRIMQAAGVPVVPGNTDPICDPNIVKELGTKYGYPIAIKASAGGGGRGLRVVKSAQEVEQALSGAQREGASYFGDGQVYVEKYLEQPHHIEVQVLADNHGNVVHLGERDCSPQRRHQKLLEETPAPKLKPVVRQKLLEAAVLGTKSIGYTSAGTLEFLVAGNDFYFLEMNTRVQVEHPITEFVTGIDIVKEQILVASGQLLSFSQSDIVPRGHAIECRINAEDPSKNFLPCPGTISMYLPPQMPWVRVDSACYSGYQVLPYYDSLLAKLIVWGRTRNEAIARMQVALNNFEIKGVATTIPFHLLLLNDPAFHAGDVYTGFVESKMKESYMALPSHTGESQSTSGPAPTVSNAPSSEQLSDARTFVIELNQKQFTIKVAEQKSTPKTITQRPRAANELSPNKIVAGSNNHSEVRSSMHGLVKELLVKLGDTVTIGQRLLIFEAMKMESEITAHKAGAVTKIAVKPGDTVNSSALLMKIGE